MQEDLVYKLEQQVEDLSGKIDDIDSQKIINQSLVEESKELIAGIEKDISRAKRLNRVRSQVKNIKIFGKAIQGVLPFLVAIAIPFTAQTLIGDIPIYPQSEFKFAHYEETIDRTGVISSDVHYNNNKNASNDIGYLYSKWEQKKDGKWYRSIKTYNLGTGTSTEKFIDAANNYENYTYGDVDDIRFEVRNDAPSEEENVAYIEFIHRYENKEDVMLVPQDLWPNIGYSLIFLVTSRLFIFLVQTWRKKSNYNFKKYCNNIKKNYPMIDIDGVIKLLEEQKIRYNTYVHPEFSLVDPVTNQKTI